MEVTVYTLPNCVQCDMTKNVLKKSNVAYNEVNLSEDAEATLLVQRLGYKSAPVVVAGDNHWSGFKLDKLKDLIK